jgi:hypothetical protein
MDIYWFIMFHTSMAGRAARLRPLFVKRFRKQIAGVTPCGFSAGSRIPGTQSRPGRPLKAFDVGFHPR